MDDVTPPAVHSGPCAECGRPLPPGTMRYCVNCGAEVTGGQTSWQPADPATALGHPASSWSTGEYRAPSPLDGMPERPPTAAPMAMPTAAIPAPEVPDVPPSTPDAVPANGAPSPPPGAAWYSDAWYSEAPAPEPAAQDGDAPWQGEPVWPNAPGPGGDTPHVLLGEAATGWTGDPAGPPVDQPAARLPVLPIAAGALLLVVVTTFGLLWLNSRDSADLTAAQAPRRTASSAPVSGPASAVAAVPSTSGAAANAPASSRTTAATDIVTALDTLLDKSAAARGDVATTAVDLQACRVPADQAAVTFRRAGDDRDRLASEASALPADAVAAVPGAGDAVRAFIALQRASAQADDAFADWAGEVATLGCRSQAPHTTNWELANRYSGEASAAKARFVRLWNPIAAGRGTETRSAGAI